jgi:hypothetical protein
MGLHGDHLCKHHRAAIDGRSVGGFFGYPAADLGPAGPRCFGAINIFPGVNLLIFGVLALVASLVCAFVACLALGATFRVARLLSSH